MFLVTPAPPHPAPPRHVTPPRPAALRPVARGQSSAPPAHQFISPLRHASAPAGAALIWFSAPCLRRPRPLPACAIQNGAGATCTLHASGLMLFQVRALAALHSQCASTQRPRSPDFGRHGPTCRPVIKPLQMRCTPCAAHGRQCRCPAQPSCGLHARAHGCSPATSCLSGATLLPCALGPRASYQPSLPNSHEHCSCNSARMCAHVPPYRPLFQTPNRSAHEPRAPWARTPPPLPHPWKAGSTRAQRWDHGHTLINTCNRHGPIRRKGGAVTAGCVAGDAECNAGDPAPGRRRRRRRAGGALNVTGGVGSG